MINGVRRPTALLVAALVVTSLVAPGGASASTVAVAVFMGGPGTAVVGGTLYARSGAPVTLFVFTDAAQCVDVTGAVTARQTAATVTTTWSFPFTAGTGNGLREATVTAWSDAAGTDCAGTAGDARTVSFVLDNEGPAVSAERTPAANAAGWNRGDVAITWSALDAGSGVESGPTPAGDVQQDETAGTVVTAMATDRLGNAGTGSVTVRLDRSAPVVAFVGGPVDGASYDVSSLPAAPGCTAEDNLSGVDGSCTVEGYATTPGTHTITAAAIDRAGNAASVAVSYAVTSWTIDGFRQPVAMGGTVNVVKGGSTVPLKFEVFDGATELTSVDAIAGFEVKAVECSTLPTQPEPIETVETGGTGVRYDLDGGQFIQTWQTPRTAGTCYEVTVTTLDGGTLTALFKTR